MGWRIRVVHDDRLPYESAVHESYNEARLTPRSDHRQNVMVSRVETVPPTSSYRYTDYWGTEVTAFDLHAPHTELAVTATSVVETAEHPPQPVRTADLGRAGRSTEVARPVHRVPWSSPPTSGRNRDLAAGGAGRCSGARSRPTPCWPPAEWVREHAEVPAPAPPGCTPSAVEAWDAAHGRLPGLRAPHAAAGTRDGRTRPATSPATCCRGRDDRSPADGAPGRATPGSRRGPAAGGASTRPTTSRSGTGTSGSPSAATTPTCPAQGDLLRRTRPHSTSRST